MKIKNLAAVIIGVLLVLQAPRTTKRDERGLSQSAETAILLAGAVVVAGIVVTVITAFVKSKLPK
jgi:energy-converting hydrogenase Eha subunit A